MASGLSGPSGFNRGVGLYEGVEGLYGGAPGLVAGPAPLVSIDFKNGIYSVDGVGKTLADLCVQNLNFAPYSASDVVNGTGYKRGPGASAAGPVLTAAAFAAIGTQFVVVMTFYIDEGAAPLSSLHTQIAMMNLPAYSNYSDAVFGRNPVGYSELDDETGIIANLGTLGYAAGRHKAAVRWGATQLAASVDGSAVYAATMTSQSASTHIGLVANSSGSTNSSAIIEKVEFFSVAAFSNANLPALSV